MAPREIALKLLPIARIHLQISWSDAELDQSLVQLMLQGMARIDYYAGENLTYDPDDSVRDIGAWRPQELLFAYLRYARGDALDEFAENYSDELAMLRLNKEAMRYAQEQEPSEG